MNEVRSCKPCLCQALTWSVPCTELARSEWSWRRPGLVGDVGGGAPLRFIEQLLFATQEDCSILINCASKMLHSSVRTSAMSPPKGTENRVHKTNEMEGEEKKQF